MGTAARRAAWKRQRADTQDSQLKRAVRRENTRVHRVCNDAYERFEGFNDWGGRGYDDFVPGEVTETPPSGDETT